MRNELPRECIEAQQEALWLIVVEGLEYAEAARILDVPQGTLRSRLSRALRPDQLTYRTRRADSSASSIR